MCVRYLSECKGLFLFYLRDLEKTKTHLEIEVAKSENRLQNLQFLEDKSEDLKIRIKTAEVGRKNYLTNHLML